MIEDKREINNKYFYYFLSTLIFICCFPISYFTHITSKYVTTLNIGVVILLFIISLIALTKSIRPSNESIILFTWIIYIIFVAWINKNLTNETVTTLLRLAIPFLFLDLCRNKLNLRIMIVKIWRFLFGITVFIDILTMLKYPAGMYTTLYTTNWFLGYKTERFGFYLILIVLSIWLDQIKHHKIGINNYILLIISLFALNHSQASASVNSLIIFGILLIIISISKSSKIIQNITKVIVNYKFILLCCLIVYFAFFSISRLSFIQNFVENVLHKDATLTTRTFIWNSLFSLFNIKSYFMGLGWLSFQDYQVLTRNPYATNPHNMFLSLLITGGIIGFVLYILLLLRIMHVKQQTETQKILLISIFTVLICGITSSAFVFTGTIYLLLGLLNSSKGEKC